MGVHLDYHRWRKDHKDIIEGLSEKRILATFSGGKDSSLALHFIRKAAKEYNLSFEVHAVSFPNHVLTKDEKLRLNSYWQKRGIIINWHESSVIDEKLNDALNQGISPCLECNRAKKEVLLKFFRKQEIKLDSVVIIINYSLWDLVSATVEHILGNIYRDESEPLRLKVKDPEERFIEISQRFYPMLTVSDGISIFKPLVRYNDQEILQAISVNNIPITRTTCDYKKYRPKRLFANYYNAMNLLFDYNKVFRFAKESLKVPDISYYEKTSLNEYLRTVF